VTRRGKKGEKKGETRVLHFLQQPCNPLKRRRRATQGKKEAGACVACRVCDGATFSCRKRRKGRGRRLRKKRRGRKKGRVHVARLFYGSFQEGGGGGEKKKKRGGAFRCGTLSRSGFP